MVCAAGPDGWRNAGAGVFPRLAMVFLVVYLVLLSVLVSWIVTGAVDFNALTKAQEGLLLTFDHTMFIGVMTNVRFGVLAANLGASAGRRIADRILQWGVNRGLWSRADHQDGSAEAHIHTDHGSSAADRDHGVLDAGARAHNGLTTVEPVLVSGLGEQRPRSRKHV